MSLLNPKESVLVALDVASSERALELAQVLEPYVGGFKVGLELFCAGGPKIVEDIGPKRVFLDLKFHDIPNTVAGACRVAAQMGVKIFNVHCLGGLDMMRAAVDATREIDPNVLLIGVTILTSHDADSLSRLGLQDSPREAVLRMADLARMAGLDGVVCSPREILPVREACGTDFLLVTPGIRPQHTDLGDQKRTLSPGEALQAGANFLVVGRPITGASDPASAAQKLFD